MMRASLILSIDKRGSESAGFGWHYPVPFCSLSCQFIARQIPGMGAKRIPEKSGGLGIINCVRPGNGEERKRMNSANNTCIAMSTSLGTVLGDSECQQLSRLAWYGFAMFELSDFIQPNLLRPNLIHYWYEIDREKERGSCPYEPNSERSLWLPMTNSDRHSKRRLNRL